MTTPPLPFSSLNEPLIGKLDLVEEKYVNTLPDSVLTIRNTFLQYRDELIKFSKSGADQFTESRTTRNDYTTKRKCVTIHVYNSLQKEFGSPEYLTGARDTVTNILGKYLIDLNGDPTKYNPLLQNVKEAHNKEITFRKKAFKIFEREFLFKQLALGYTETSRTGR